LPCLDPDVKAPPKKKNVAIPHKRFIETDETLGLSLIDSISKEKVEFDDLTSNDLAVNFPCYYSFYPTDQIMNKLIRRMT
jgi:hypothetical protein